MNTTATLLLLFGMAGVTYLARRAFLRLPSGIFSSRLKNGLTFIPLGIFSALIFPSLFVREGHLVIQPLFLAASALCLLLMAISRNVFVSFGVSLLFVVLVSTGVLPLPLG